MYLEAGISLVKNADYCSPEDINKSHVLIEVQNCVRKASIEEIEFAETDNPILKNQKTTFIYLLYCRKLFKERGINIQSETDVATALISHTDLDSKVCKYIRESGYLEHYDSDEIHSPYRYNIDLFLKKYEKTLTPGNEILIKEFQSLYPIIERQLQNYQISKQNYLETELEYYSLYIGLYKNILLSSKKWLFTLHQFSKEIGQTDFTQDSFSLLQYIESIID